MKRILASIAVSVSLLGCSSGSPSDQQISGTSCNELGQFQRMPENGVETEFVCTQEGEMNVWRPIGDGGNGGGSGDESSSGSASSTSPLAMLGDGQCDISSTVSMYSESIGDVSKMAYIYPLGGMLTTHITPIDHIYIYYPQMSDDHSVAAGSYLVTSPAAGRVVNVEDFQKNNNYPYPDYRVVIEHSCSLYSVFIHIGELQGASKTWLETRQPVAVKAGEVVADDSYSPGYDFSTFDGDLKLTGLLNLASYSQTEQWKPFTANPFNYFPANIKSQLEAKSLRVTAPFDGKMDWDLAGTAQGNWFVAGSNGYAGLGSKDASYDNHGKVAHGYWDTHLAVAPDAVDDTAFIYSIGDWEGCPCQFMSVGNVDPKTIKAATTPTVISLVEFDGGKGNNPSKGYKLTPSSSVVGLLALQVMTDGSMKVEKLPGVTSAEAFKGFSANAVTYVR